MEEYMSSNRSKHLIQYHFIFCTKYRHKIFMFPEICEDLKIAMIEISNKYDFWIKTLESDKDHIHLLIRSVPKISPSQICRVLKQESTFKIYDKHAAYLKQFYWKGRRMLWSDGYFVTSIGNASEETIRKYIESQG